MHEYTPHEILFVITYRNIISVKIVSEMGLGAACGR